jgi:hypothetical protein
MSKYTTEVRYICETYAGHTESQDYSKIDDIIASSINKIFDFDFPIFDENYRSVLETKIIRHYYTREIGLETVALWKHFLCMRLNEIMPYYNKLYESELLQFNPLYDYDLYRKRDVENEGSGKDTGTLTNVGNGESSSTGLTAFSDTPQGGLAGLENLTYLTNATKTSNENENSNTNTETRNLANSFTNTEDYLEHVYGKTPSRSYAQMIKEYRENFLNIDVDIINNLNDLFMGVW